MVYMGRNFPEYIFKMKIYFALRLCSAGNGSIKKVATNKDPLPYNSIRGVNKNNIQIFVAP